MSSLKRMAMRMGGTTTSKDVTLNNSKYVLENHISDDPTYRDEVQILNKGIISCRLTNYRKDGDAPARMDIQATLENEFWLGDVFLVKDVKTGVDSRTDLLAEEIIKMFNWNINFGFELELRSDRENPLNEHFYYRELVFESIISNIDNTIYILLATYLRQMHIIKKNIDIGGDENGKKYLLDKERRRLDRQRNNKFESMLAPLISAMVNCEQFKYDHKTVWDLPIYVFMDCVRRIQKLKNYNQTMQGI